MTYKQILLHVSINHKGTKGVNRSAYKWHLLKLKLAQ